VSAQHAESSVKVRNTGNIDMAHLLAAANAVVNPANGQTVCNAALTNAAYANCVPINLFGPTSESQAALYYVTGLTASDALSIFNDISGTITGSPFATWAGPVNMAVSGEWRRLDYHLDSYTQPGDLADCSGIQFSCTQGTQVRWLNNTLSNRSRVNERVAEVAYEADVPLIADKPFFQAFNVNGAVRYTNYATSGGVTTWKLGADWSINDEVKLRATRSRDIRAPNLNDLYNPAQPNRSSRFDLHTNTTNITSAVANSNPDLVPEEADTYTVGAVYRPSFLPGLNLSVDGYHIKVNDAIIVVSGTNSQVQQACEDSAGTSPLCDLFIRPLPFSNHTAANFPTQMSGAPLNIASIETYGLDFEAGYATEVFSRPLNLRALVAYQPHLIYDAGPSGKADIAGTNGGQIGYGNSSSSPAVKLTAIAKYDVTDNLSVTVMERWRGEMAASANNTLVYTTGGTVPSIAYTNLNVAYKFGTMGGDTELYLNVQNLFDKYPEGFGLSSGDDQVGRYFTVGLRSKF
jgi:outer membrane receptor protein involved in Fe transport